MAEKSGNGTTEHPTRESIREQIFSKKNFATRELDLYGAKVEIRQPSLGMILDAQRNDDTKAAIVELLIRYTFVPGTEDHVFEEADAEGLLNLPFGPELSNLNKIITELTDIDVLGEEKNSASTPSAETSSS